MFKIDSKDKLKELDEDCMISKANLKRPIKQKR